MKGGSVIYTLQLHPLEFSGACTESSVEREMGAAVQTCSCVVEIEKTKANRNLVACFAEREFSAKSALTRRQHSFNSISFFLAQGLQSSSARECWIVVYLQPIHLLLLSRQRKTPLVCKAIPHVVNCCIYSKTLSLFTLILISPL